MADNNILFVVTGCKRIREGDCRAILHDIYLARKYDALFSGSVISHL